MGFIGLGVAGTPMARHLVEAGFPLRVYDLNEARMLEGATRATSSADAAAGSDTVLTLLPSADDVEEVLVGPDGVADGAEPGTTAIDFSTIPPERSIAIGSALEERGVRYVEAAVMGVPTVAEAGELGIFAAGDEALVADHEDIFSAVGSETFYMGPVGNAKRTKIANNTFSVLCRLALYEVSSWLVANDVELERYVTVLRNFAARPMANPADRLLELLHDGWDTTGRTGRVSRLHEDLGFCLTLGREAGVPLPLTERAVQLLDGAVADGLAGEGPSSMAKLFPVGSSEQLRSP